MSNLPEDGETKSTKIVGTPLTPPRRVYGAMNAMEDLIAEDEDRSFMKALDQAVESVAVQTDLECAAQALREIQAEETQQQTPIINIFLVVPFDYEGFIREVFPAPKKPKKKRAPAKTKRKVTR